MLVRTHFHTVRDEEQRTAKTMYQRGKTIQEMNDQ